MRRVILLAVALVLAVPAPVFAAHRGGYCDNYGCDDRGGDGGESGGHQGYGGGGGRSGDYDGGPGDDCRNACGNTIVVPMPGDRGGGRGE